MMYVILWQHNKDEPMFNHRISSRYLGIDDEVPRMEYLSWVVGFCTIRSFQVRHSATSLTGRTTANGSICCLENSTAALP